jgi:hypothetical protein
MKKYLKFILLLITSIIFGIIFGIIGLIIGATIGGNFGFFEFFGNVGYEAGGLFFGIVGICMGPLTFLFLINYKKIICKIKHKKN